MKIPRFNVKFRTLFWLAVALALPVPGNFDLIGYETVLKQGDFFGYFQNAMIVTVASLALVLLFGAMADRHASPVKVLRWLALATARASARLAMPLNLSFAAAPPVFAAIRNARILVLGYLWGSFALFCFYRLTGLRWQPCCARYRFCRLTVNARPTPPASAQHWKPRRPRSARAHPAASRSCTARSARRTPRA